jgi:hypothetical protein
MQYDPPIDTGKANADIWELIQALVLGRVPAGRILELFYWGQQPGALEMVRAFLDLPPKNRAMMSAFLSVTGPKSISVEVDRSGRLILSSPDVTEAASILREAERATTEMDPHDQPPKARKT